jgi:segregation and condensation protein A
VVPDVDYRIKLQVFEGPLDLLLFLIRKNELDIYDIPIESVTKQYIAALHTMQQLDLEVAGEFFVMAATLMEIKSRMLLPRGQHAIDPNADDEEVDPRWELVHQLLQYKKFKEAAVKLAELVETRQNLMARHVSELTADLVDRPLKSVDRIELWNAFNIVLRRLAEKLVVGEIHDEVVTVADQMEWLLERTRENRSFVFTDLFPEGVTLRRLVATFLAMLELTRLKKLRIRQSEAFADIIAEAVIETPPAPVAEGSAGPADGTALNGEPAAAIVIAGAADTAASATSTSPVETPAAPPVADVASSAAASETVAPESAAPEAHPHVDQTAPVAPATAETRIDVAPPQVPAEATAGESATDARDHASADEPATPDKPATEKPAGTPPAAAEESRS